MGRPCAWASAALALFLFPCELLPRQADGVSQELLSDIVSSIALKGCDAFQGNELRKVSDLQECYASTQENSEAAALIRATTAATIKSATVAAIKTIRDVYQVEIHFEWVLDHEGELQNCVSLANRGQFEQIREIYKAHQSDYKIHNLVSALSDWELQQLINRANHVSGSSAPSQPLADVSSVLVDRVARSISYSGCQVFTKESISPPETLRSCYLSAQEENHDGEAYDQIKTASGASITLATQRAITKIRDLYNAKDAFEIYLTHSGLLERMKSLVQVGAFADIRKEFASSHPPTAADRYLLNALADSEIAAIVNLPRLTVLIPSGATTGTLASISALLATRSIDIDAETTPHVLGELVCGDEKSKLPGQVGPPAIFCEQMARVAIQPSGAVESDGRIVGASKVEVPILPPIGVPTQVTFRSGVTRQTVTAALASVGIKFEEPRHVALIQPEQNVSLAADTVKKYKDNGLRWFAYAISADKIRSKDLALASSIHVGIVDAGVDSKHTALTPFFWQLPFVFPNAKWTQGSIGYDYLKKVSDPSEEKETESHGTHITGLVTARALALWFDEFKALKLEDHVKVYCLKIAGQNGIPDFTFPAQALYEAIPDGIHLFNLSLDGPESGLVRDQIRAQGQQALIVLAAGNHGTDMNYDTSANGTFRDGQNGKSLSNVIIVGALMDVGNLTPKSNHGSLAVEIAAPGNNIYSTIEGGQFGTLTGTSQAAPLVTSTAAILLVERNDAYPSQVKERILSTCDWEKALENLVTEGCKLNMAKAITYNADIIELNSLADTNPPSHKWLYGSLGANKLQIKDDGGNALDPTKLHRIWILDGNGNVRVAVRGGGHVNAKMSTTKIAIQLDDGQECPGGATQPCEVELKDIRDVVFRWQL
jgi:subtilisin family serine protease